MALAVVSATAALSGFAPVHQLPINFHVNLSLGQNGLYNEAQYVLDGTGGRAYLYRDGYNAHTWYIQPATRSYMYVYKTDSTGCNCHTNEQVNLQTPWQPWANSVEQGPCSNADLPGYPPADLPKTTGTLYNDSGVGLLPRTGQGHKRAQICIDTKGTPGTEDDLPIWSEFGDDLRVYRDFWVERSDPLLFNTSILQGELPGCGTMCEQIP